VNFSRLRLGIGLAVILGIATATAGLAQNAPDAQAPSPAATAAPVTTAAPVVTPAPVLTPAPSPSPTGGPRRGRRAATPGGGVPSPNASPSDTPEPPQFTTLDGIWEVEAQPIGKRLATYTHLSINTTGADINGYYQTTGKKGIKYPMTGTFDGRLISMSVSMPNGQSMTFNGYVETFADMVGLYKTSDSDPGTAFTAQHRKKMKN
jgi:hypothetical protein